MYAAVPRKRQVSLNIWPGYVDVLSTLLMVIIFVLMVFVIAQFFLSTALSSKDDALIRLNRQIAELGELLALERGQTADLQLDLAELSAELQRSLTERDALSQRLAVVIGERDTAQQELSVAQGRLGALGEATGKVEAELADAYRTIEADRAKIEALLGDIAALESLRNEMAAKLLGSEQALGQAAEQLKSAETARENLSEEASLRVAILNRQILALRRQLAEISAALDLSEAKASDQEIQIANLSQRLNTALASKVEELARYRSEFFGRLREVLGERKDIQVVGDRFVFQSEVLFESGSAEIGTDGQEQLGRFAATLREIGAGIPADLDWILRVDGHTDRRPIVTAVFPSNWELSAARAIAVVKFLASEGIAPNRLVAAGFGEFRPLDPGEDDGALRRNRRIEMKLDQR